MSFLLRDAFDELEPSEIGSPLRVSHEKPKVSIGLSGTLSGGKFRIPDVKSALERKRLIELLERSVEQYGATLVSGRAGTGKTVLAAEFAKHYQRVSWYSVEPADRDWPEFAASFAFCLLGSKKAKTKSVENGLPDGGEISRFLTRCLDGKSKSEQRLLVLDNVHYLFDSPWFSEFFRQLILSLNGQTRLLMLCRSKPNAPLWRMRSKQMLNVIEESLINFTASEARDLGARRGISGAAADEALRRSYGNISKLIKALKSLARR
ncbi:MAG TPA: AAA family ATPase [Pyrinomonadaceae bacterium]|nr:AAA family ATPase [Pyrinomonadaceae bacterium]